MKNLLSEKYYFSICLKIFLICCLFISSILVFAQKQYLRTLQGNVVDSITHKPLAYTTIQIFSLKDSVFYSGAISDTNGYFSFTDIKESSFYLVFSYVGYDQKIVVPDLTPKKIIDLGYTGQIARIWQILLFHSTYSNESQR